MASTSITSTSIMDSHLSVTVIRASKVRWTSILHTKSPNLYVQMELNNKTRQTNTIKKNAAPTWNESFSFNLPAVGQQRKLIIQIRHDSSLWPDKCVGKVEMELDNLLGMCVIGTEMELCLNMPHGSTATESAAVLHLRLEIIDTMMRVDQDVKATEQAIQQSRTPALAIGTESTKLMTLDAIASHVSEHTDLYQSVETLVSKLNVFVRAVDTLSQVHPYVNFAWQVASALYKAIEHQFEVDKKIVELVHAMRDAFEFTDDIKTLPNKTASVKSTIKRLLEQTSECCLFIQEYSRHDFARRMAMITTDATVDNYLKGLQKLKSSIDSGIAVHIAFVSSRISFKVDALYNLVLKSRLNPDEMSKYDRPECLPGTRSEIQKEIVEWASSCTDKNVYWLHGVVGCGKSTVSTTIAQHFRAISRLGAHLFFERGKSDPSSVIRTLAYKLASFDSSVAKYVVEAIEEDNDIALGTATDQFERLLQGPLTSAEEVMHGPVVIVLDALDECGTERNRKSLLDVFQQKLGELPKNFRILITSRKEADINRALSSRPEYICAVELDYDTSSCKEDVQRYIDYKMCEVFTKNGLNIQGDCRLNIDCLGRAANGLFIWASTVVKLIDCDDPIGKLIELASNWRNLSGLEQLYESVLTGSGISFDNKTSNARFSQILGLILVSRALVSDVTIDELLGYPDGRSSQLILSRLQSVLAYTPGRSVRFYHTSFRDYLLSPRRANDPWYIDLESQKEVIALQCFSVMNDRLCFNICNIESSYICNDQIPDLQDRIEKNISPHLKYTCLFWTHHLREVPFSSELLKKLSEFLHKHLLYWLEVMSLLGTVNTVSPTLFHAMNWVSTHDVGLLAFLRDARRTITLYSLPMSQCTAHIYTSVLPLAAKNSKVMAHYFNSNAATVQVDQMGNKQQSPLLKELTGHTSPVFSVGFSRNGTRVVSGSSDKTIRIWDAESERIVSDPFKGHTNWVRSVAFSPNSLHIVSGSADKTVRLWDVENGQAVSKSFKGHTSWIWSVAFSPDGTRVVSGSADATIIVWSVESGQAISGPFKGHVCAVTSVAFSPNGYLIASGSDDKTIRIWNSESGQAVLPPFEAHAYGIKCVCFSPCGTRLVSGSDDKTILIWNVDNGQVIYGPFQGHRGTVSSVAFSHDGNRIVSCSSDRTIRIWDVESGQVVSGPFEGHTDRIHSVGFSPDGAYVVSGSDDKTVRIWDAEHGQAIAGQFDGHTDGINSVAFSQDGNHIISGSRDNTIRIWDVGSGQIISDSFEGYTHLVRSQHPLPDNGHIDTRSHNEVAQTWSENIVNGQTVSGPFPEDTDWVQSVAFSPFGSCIGTKSTVRVWDSGTRNAISRSFEAHTNQITSVAFSPDGLHVVSGSQDKTIILCNIESGQIISGPLEGHTDTVCAIAFSADSSHVVSGSADRTVIVWHAKSGQVISGPLEGHTGNICSVAFSPDGTLVVSSSLDKTIRIWNVESGQTVCAPLKGHTGPVLSVAFSPDGQYVVSGSEDKTIRIWNITGPNINWTLHTDGWIRGDSGELLMWIPADLRQTLCLAQNDAVLSCQFSTKLDFTHAALGEQWQDCFVLP